MALAASGWVEALLASSVAMLLSDDGGLALGITVKHHLHKIMLPLAMAMAHVKGNGNGTSKAIIMAGCISKGYGKCHLHEILLPLATASRKRRWPWQMSKVMATTMATAQAKKSTWQTALAKAMANVICMEVFCHWQWPTVNGNGRCQGQWQPQWHK